MFGEYLGRRFLQSILEIWSGCLGWVGLDGALGGSGMVVLVLLPS